MGEGRSLFLIKRRCNVYLVPNETAKILSTFNQSKIHDQISHFYGFCGNTRSLFSFQLYLNTIVQILPFARISSS